MTACTPATAQPPDLPPLLRQRPRSMDALTNCPNRVVFGSQVDYLECSIWRGGKLRHLVANRSCETH
jgi:hypothetical protein